MTPQEARALRGTILAILALVLVRLVAAAYTPLAFDEAYYWTWSKHLASGYYDHPPMVALVIRLGTMIAGNNEFGVRLISILLVLPMTWAVYRSAAILFGGQRVAATAAIMLNATLMVAVGTMIVTPDAPLMVAASFLLFFLAKVLATGRGAWWLAVGAAAGAGLLSKYTALFFGPAILIWLAVTPKLRQWLWSPWLYLGGLLALTMFAPVVLWNADHQWVSFLKQFGRARFDEFNLRYILEVIPAQVALATPLVFVLGVMGLYALSARNVGALGARTLINCMVWPIIAYFAWHALHSRVEGNWLGPVYPAFAVAASATCTSVSWRGGAQTLVGFCRRWGPPSGLLLFALLALQVNTGLLTGYRRDVTARLIGVGWQHMADEIEALRVQTGATCVLATDYSTTSWLMFYLPRGTCVAEQSERIRWVNAPEPDPAMLTGKILFVDQFRPGGHPELAAKFARVEKVAELKRMRGPLLIDTIEVDLAEDAKGEVLDRSPAYELLNHSDDITSRPSP